MVLDKRNSPNEYLENIGFCDGIKNQGFYGDSRVNDVRREKKKQKKNPARIAQSHGVLKIRHQ